MACQVISAEQGSEEWFAARAGVPSASRFKDIVTPTGKAVTGAKRIGYMRRLLAEWDADGRLESPATYWMQRGSELEPQAREYLEFAIGETIAPVGFCLAGSGYGASPDGLIGDTAIVEIKCPAPETLMGWRMDGGLPDDHKAQVQGQMLVTGRRKAVFLGYHPQMTPHIVRVDADLEYQEKLHDALVAFIDDLCTYKGKLAND